MNSEALRLNLFRGHEIVEGFISDANDVVSIPIDIFADVLDKAFLLAFKEQRITDTELKEWSDSIKFDLGRIKIGMRFFIFLAKQCILLKLSKDQIQDDLVNLKIPQDKIDLIAKRVFEDKESIDKEVFKGRGFRIQNFDDITWSVDLRIRDEYQDQIMKPVAILDIGYNTMSEGDRHLIFEITATQLDILIGSLNNASRALKKISAIEQKFLEIWLGEHEK